MWLWALLLVPVLVYAAILALIYFAQTSLLFPVQSVGSPGPMPSAWQRLSLETEPGHRLHGVHVPPASPGQDRLLILAFGGNAWNAESAAAYIHVLVPTADVIAFHYSGYPPSGGTPAAAELQQDALAVHDLARQRFRNVKIVAMGFSIGSGVASYLAAHRPIDGAILVTPFDSLAQVAADHYPWLPVRFLFRHRMEPAADLQGSSVPVALIVAGNDRLIRPARAASLAEAAGNLVFNRAIAGASHNDIYDRDAFRAAVQDALEALGRPPER